MFGLYQILLNTKKGTCKLQTGKETNRQVFTKKKGGKPKLGSFEGYKRQIKNTFFLKKTQKIRIHARCLNSFRDTAFHSEMKSE